MSHAQSLLEELHLEIGSAESRLVQAEGGNREARIHFRNLAIQDLRTAQRNIERATKLIEQQLYQSPDATA